MKSYYGWPIGTHQRSIERYHPRPPTASHSTNIGCTQPKTAIALISGTGKVTDCKFGRYIHRVHALKIGEKRERGRIHGLPIFCVPPIISGAGKATNFKFRRYIYRFHTKKSPLKFWR